MSVDTVFIRTHRGDEVMVNLFDFPGQEPTVCITVDDVDDCKLPTIEFDLGEVATLREVLRKMCEEATTL